MFEDLKKIPLNYVETKTKKYDKIVKRKYERRCLEKGRGLPTLPA